MNKEEKVIISMTSFPAAITYAEKAIQSLLEGSVLPYKIVLYLTYSQFGEAGLPESLKRLEKENPIFEIRNYDLDIRSYRKLIPAVKDFPDYVIVTVDDDVHYHRHMLRRMLDVHRRMPNAVIAHRAKRIKKGLPYKKWRKYRWYSFLLKRYYVRFDTLQTGVGGVLYPPHSLNTDMLKPEVFTALAPTSDDIWFWASAVSNGVPVVPVPFGQNKPRGLGKPRTLDLKQVNFKRGEDRNAAALKRILERYPDIEEKLKQTVVSL